MSRVFDVCGVICVCFSENKIQLMTTAWHKYVVIFWSKKNSSYLCIVHQLVSEWHHTFGCLLHILPHKLVWVYWYDKHKKKGQHLFRFELMRTFVPRKTDLQTAYSINTSITFWCGIWFGPCEYDFTKKVLILAATMLPTTVDIHSVWHIRSIIGT